MTPAATRLSVAVIGGGRNSEHEVSLSSAKSVIGALDPDAYEVRSLTIGKDGQWYLAGDAIPLAQAVTVLQSCDIAFPVLHGPHGEDGEMAALCEIAGVPYVGAGVRSGAIAMDKWVTKLVADAIGIATAPARLVRASESDSVIWHEPVVVKPVASGSSCGVSLVREAPALADALREAFRYDDRVLVEKLVVGREIDIAVVGGPGTRRVSPPLEIIADGLFDYETKYGGNAQFRVPAPIDPGDRKAIEQAALAIFDALDCRGLARIDFFLTDDGPVLNEVNTMPGMTGHSQVPQMFAADGISYSALLDSLIRDALSRRQA